MALATGAFGAGIDYDRSQLAFLFRYIFVAVVVKAMQQGFKETGPPAGGVDKEPV